MLAQTVHFGTIEVWPEDVIEFVAPLPPFVQLRRYALLEREEESPFRWLQSLEEPALALVVAPYEVVVGEAPPAASQGLRKELGLRAGEEAQVYVIISLGQQARESTMNLLAPLYLCERTGRARQVIVGEDLGLARTALMVDRQ
ncbi:MAG: flagellar assembly protein FliW [Armatimonadia bacterium]